MKTLSTLVLLSILSTLAHADVCTVAREGRMSLTLMQNVSRNVYDEFTCSERRQDAPTGAALAACQDLHTYSCSQTVVKDPLSASYPDEASVGEFESRFRQEILPKFSGKLRELEAGTPLITTKISALLSSGNTRERVDACLYEHISRRWNIFQSELSPECSTIVLLPAWDELLSTDGVGSTLRSWLHDSMTSMIVASRKHQTLTQVIFPQAKALMIRFMETQSAANPTQAQNYDKMKQRLQGLVLREPNYLSSLRGSSQMAVTERGEVLCNHTAVVKGNFADIAHGMIHEMAHQIDPCVSSEAARRNSFQPDEPEILFDFPIKNLMSCLQTETGLSMGGEETFGFVCNHAGESFSDFIATVLLPHLLPMIYGDTLKTPDDYAQAYAGIGRSFSSFCSPETDGRHPTWNTRINMLVGSNPVIRSQLGCPQLNVPGSSCFQLLSSPCP